MGYSKHTPSYLAPPFLVSAWIVRMDCNKHKSVRVCGCSEFASFISSSTTKKAFRQPLIKVRGFSTAESNPRPTGQDAYQGHTFTSYATLLSALRLFAPQRASRRAHLGGAGGAPGASRPGRLGDSANPARGAACAFGEPGTQTRQPASLVPSAAKSGPGSTARGGWGQF